MQKLRFYKTSQNRWHVDLEDWTGDIAELEMVSGADTMLDFLSNNGKEIYLNVSDEYFEGSEKLDFVRNATEIDNGAFYKFSSYKGQTFETELELWLCDVTLFVFNYFPKTIYLSVL